jgi:hypothetical protein
MKEISNQEFIEKYKPIENCRFPTFDTIIPQEHPLNPFIWDTRECTLIAEYLPHRCFFTLHNDMENGEKRVSPGQRHDYVLGYIITHCPWRPENQEYTVVEY